MSTLNMCSFPHYGVRERTWPRFISNIPKQRCQKKSPAFLMFQHSWEYSAIYRQEAIGKLKNLFNWSFSRDQDQGGDNYYLERTLNGPELPPLVSPDIHLAILLLVKLLSPKRDMLQGLYWWSVDSTSTTSTGLKMQWTSLPWLE